MDVHLITDSEVEQRTVEELPDLLEQRPGLIWVDMPKVDAEALRVLGEVFRFHPLAIQDCENRNHVPKVHIYPDHVFVALHSPELGTGGRVHHLELDQFIGPGYLVTVHGPLDPEVIPELAFRETDAVLKRIRAGRMRPTRSFELSHAIVSAMTRHQEGFVGILALEVGLLEQRVMGDSDDDPEEFLEELFRARAARFLRRRLDPEAATGLALTVALVLIFAAAAGFGLVAEMVTDKTGLYRFDASAAAWGAEHATPTSTWVLGLVTWLGATVTVLSVTVALGVLAMLATCAQTLLFLLCLAAPFAVPLTVDGPRRRGAVIRWWLLPLLASAAVLAFASLASLALMRLANALHSSDEYVGMLLAGSTWPLLFAVVSRWWIVRRRKLRRAARVHAIGE
jgi:Mg2+ and Co2+ transporter CorA